MCIGVSEEPTGSIIRVEECSFVTWVQCLPKRRYKSNEGMVSHLRRRLSLKTCIFFLFYGLLKYPSIAHVINTVFSVGP